MRTALVLAAALVAVSSAASATPAKRLTAKSDGVRATVTWRGQTPVLKDIRVRIRRNGTLRLDQRMRKVYDLPVKLRVHDLDGNGEPEVIADLYTGGAHCCWYSLIYGYLGGQYKSLKQQWGDQQYGFADLDGNGVLEVRSADDRFAYVFTAYAGSAFPVQLWNYRAGKMVDTTRRFPVQVRRDARTLWRAYRRERRQTEFDVRGVLSAWMADQYLLGRQSSGWTTMRKINARGELEGFAGGGDIWPKGTKYLKALRKFLVKLGYA